MRKKKQKMREEHEIRPEFYPVDRTARNGYPEATQPVYAVPLPTAPGFDGTTYTNNVMYGLPEYTCTDEYGRVYKARVTYGAMPHSGPVPIPTPDKVVQTTAINVPVSFNK